MIHSMAQGRDVLIGGTGIDDLKGGDDDDLLIAGYTSYDSHVANLKSIMAEWGSTRDYPTRVNNLRAGTGPVLTGTGVKLKTTGTDRTVFDEGLKDTIKGDNGRDWFFASMGDNLKDKKSDETTDTITP